MLSKTLSKETLIQKLKKANIKGPMIGKKLVVVNKEQDSSVVGPVSANTKKQKIKLAPNIIN